MNDELMFYQKLDEVFNVIFNTGLPENRDDSLLQKLITLIERGTFVSDEKEYKTLFAVDKKRVVEQTQVLQFLRQPCPEDLQGFTLQLARVLALPDHAGLAAELARDGLTSPRPEVRCAALDCLAAMARLQAPEDLEELFTKTLPLLDDSSFYVRKSAVHLLQKLQPTSSQVLELWSYVDQGKMAALDVLSSAPPDLTPAQHIHQTLDKVSPALSNSTFCSKLAQLVVSHPSIDPTVLLEERAASAHSHFILCLASSMLLLQKGNQELAIRVLTSPLLLEGEVLGPLTPAFHPPRDSKALGLVAQKLAQLPASQLVVERVVPLVSLQLVRGQSPRLQSLLVEALSQLCRRTPEWSIHLHPVLLDLLGTSSLEESLLIQVLQSLRDCPGHWQTWPPQLVSLAGISSQVHDSCLELLAVYLCATTEEKAEVPAWVEPMVAEAYNLAVDPEEDSSLRCSALRLVEAALGCPDRVRPPWPLPQLAQRCLAILRKDETTLVRRAAAGLLGHNALSPVLQGLAETATTLAECLACEMDWATRLAAMLAAQKLLPAAALQIALSKAQTEDPDPQVRSQAAALLAQAPGAPTSDLYTLHPLALLEDIAAAVEVAQLDCYPD